LDIKILPWLYVPKNIQPSCESEAQSKEMLSREIKANW